MCILTVLLTFLASHRLYVTMVQPTYKVSKRLLKELLTEERYSKLRSFYHKTYRHLTNPKLPGFLSKLPDFIILGAQKCGTSSLYSYLSYHPQVIPASRKKVHFFDNNFDKGAQWYRKHFPSVVRMVSGEYITGEASPYYLYHPRVARRISNVVPDAKLIILLRDPVDRAISHYWHEVTYCEAEELPMKEAIEREEKRLEGEEERLLSEKDYYSFKHQHFSYLSRGKYISQIERFREHFDDESILIIKSERFFEETQNVYDDVTDLLNIDRYIIDVAETKMEGEYKRDTPQSIRSSLEEYYSEQKDQIEEELGISFEQS